MSLEERTLVVRNIDGDRLSADLLEELFANFGKVVKVVLRKNFAFIEYTKKDSVGYAWAMTEGICMQGRQLRIMPKLEDDPFYYTYRDALNTFENRMVTDKQYVASLLTSEQIKEKNNLVNALNARSNNNITTIRRRLRQYELHCQPKSTYNAILERDLAKECNRYDQYSSPQQEQQSGSHQRSQSLDHSGRQAADNWFQQHNNYMQQHSNTYFQSQPDMNQTWHPGMDYNQGNHPDWGHYEQQHQYEPPHGHNQHMQHQYDVPPPQMHQYGHSPPQGPASTPQPQGHFQPHPNQFRPYPPPSNHKRFY